MYAEMFSIGGRVGGKSFNDIRSKEESCLRLIPPEAINFSPSPSSKLMVTCMLCGGQSENFEGRRTAFEFASININIVERLVKKLVQDTPCHHSLSLEERSESRRRLRTTRKGKKKQHLSMTPTLPSVSSRKSMRKKGRKSPLMPSESICHILLNCCSKQKAWCQSMQNQKPSRERAGKSNSTKRNNIFLTCFSLLINPHQLAFYFFETNDI